METDYDSLSTGDLVTRSQEKDLAAFEVLLKRYHGAVYGVAYAWLKDREQAEDLAQESWLRIYLHLVAENSVLNFPGWAAAVTRNLAANWLRSGQRRSSVIEKLISTGQGSGAMTSSSTPRDELISTEEQQRVRKAVLDLPADLREVVVLHYAEDMSQSEIARILGVQPSTIGRQLERARKMLRVRLEEDLRGALSKIKSSPQAAVASFAAVAAFAAFPISLQAEISASAGELSNVVQNSAASQPALPNSVWTKLISSGWKVKVVSSAIAAGVAATTVIAVDTLQTQRFSAPTGKTETHPKPAIAPYYNAGPAQANRRLLTRKVGAPKAAKTDVSTSRVWDSSTTGINALLAVSPHQVSTRQISTSGTASFLSVPFTVLDSQRFPLEGAQVVLTEVGYRTDDFSKAYEMPKPYPITASDQNGSFTLTFQFDSWDYEAAVRSVNFLTCEIKHVDYATTTTLIDLTCVRPIILLAGHTVALRATLEGSSEIAGKGLAVITGTKSGVTTSSWSMGRDGLHLASRVNAGTHSLWLQYPAADGGMWHSNPFYIQVPEGTSEPVTAMLRKAATLKGRVVISGSEPVTSGVVEMLPANYPGGLRTTSTITAIGLDGSFVISNVPRGDVRLVAVVDGWISESGKSKDPEQATMHWVPVTANTDSLNEQLLLPMVPTGSAEIEIVDPDGRPVPNAKITVNGSIQWERSFSNFEWVGNRNTQAITDASGKATITSVPPMNLHISASHDSYVMEIDGRPIRDGKSVTFNSETVSVKSGEISKRKVIMRPKFKAP